MKIDDKLAAILVENESLKNTIKDQKNEIFKLKKVIANLPASVYWKDRQGRYLGRNRFAAEKMLEVGLEQTVDVDDVNEIPAIKSKNSLENILKLLHRYHFKTKVIEKTVDERFPADTEAWVELNHPRLFIVRAEQ